MQKLIFQRKNFYKNYHSDNIIEFLNGKVNIKLMKNYKVKLMKKFNIDFQ